MLFACCLPTMNAYALIATVIVGKVLKSGRVLASLKIHAEQCNFSKHLETVNVNYRYSASFFNISKSSIMMLSVFSYLTGSLYKLIKASKKSLR